MISNKDQGIQMISKDQMINVLEEELLFQREKEQMLVSKDLLLNYLKNQTPQDIYKNINDIKHYVEMTPLKEKMAFFFGDDMIDWYQEYPEQFAMELIPFLNRYSIQEHLFSHLGFVLMPDGTTVLLDNAFDIRKQHCDSMKKAAQMICQKLNRSLPRYNDALAPNTAMQLSSPEISCITYLNVSRDITFRRELDFVIPENLTDNQLEVMQKFMEVLNHENIFETIVHKHVDHDVLLEEFYAYSEYTLKEFQELLGVYSLQR